MWSSGRKHQVLVLPNVEALEYFKLLGTRKGDTNAVTFSGDAAKICKLILATWDMSG